MKANRLETINIKTNTDLADFVSNLLLDFRTNKDTWENADLESYFSAMEAWLRDCEGYYKNNHLPFPDGKAWQLVADVLMASKIYE